ncbi:MAG: crossover junction endodeoxyribonuclease RuvC [Gammaproteobacteria bacterium]|nr:crossover junction endodeoxyribonuclease RuvC [Gammaproteobacteria bacterium]
MRRILGIDPGSRITGYGVIESDGRKSVHIASGCIKLSQGDLPQRLGEIYRAVSQVIQEYAPTEMAVEEVFVSKNPSSALKLGHARGAAVCAGVMAGLEIAEYTPRRIKQAVVGTGAADKEQVQHMIKLILQLKEKLAADQADALAVAISHAHSNSTLLNIKAGGRR